MMEGGSHEASFGAAPAAASPLATGDYGGRFQDAVGGWFLAHLLMGTQLSGVTGTVSRVGFQRRTQGALLDDAVVGTTAGLTVEFSVKAGITITATDPELRETLSLAWARAQMAAEHRSGLVAPPSATGISAFAHLLFLSQQHEQVADFMRSIEAPGVVSAANRRRFGACRTILDNINHAPISDAQFHSFLRRFVLLQLDFAMPPHRDLETIVATLTAVQGISREDASVLFDRLVCISEEAAIASAARERSSLIAELRLNGVSAGLPSDLRPHITAFHDYAQRTFESRNDTVAGVRLDRSSIVQTIITTLANGNSALLTGPSGYGKSAALRATYARRAEAGPVLHLSGRRIAAAASWADLADDIGIPRDRALLADILATNAHGATIIVDAVEHVQASHSRLIINDLLRDLGSRCGQLNVVLATRDILISEMFHWLDVSSLPPLQNIVLARLSSEDIGRIAAASPPLGALIGRVGTNLIPGGLLILRLLHDARIPDRVLAETPATEADLLDVWWDNVLVGRDLDRYDRLAIARSAAQEVVRSAGGLFRLPSGLNGVAIASLEVDGVLALDRQSDCYRFGHDIVQDWAVVRWLDGEGSAARTHVTTIAQSPGFYRCVALFAQRIAERDMPRFDALLYELEYAHDERGQHAFLSALALSPQATRLLDERAVALFENTGARLAKLLTVLRIEQIDINTRVVDFAIRQGSDIGAASSLAVANGMPHHVVWAPALRLCLAHLDSLGCATLPFAKMADRWQQTTPQGFPLRDPLFAAMMRILAQLEDWQTREPSPTTIAVTYEDRGAIGTAARSSVAHAAEVNPSAVVTYLTDLRENGHSDAQDDMLKLAGVLGATLTDEVVEFILAILIDEPREPWEYDSSELGLRAHIYFPASDVQGPFLALLRQNATAGLAVVHQLVRHASERYQRREAQGPHGAHWRPLTFTFRGRAVSVAGDERAYNWFRPGSHDSAVLTSALMAVDTWALEVVRSGRDAAEVADLLLTDTEAAAFLGIVVGLAYDIPALAADLVDVVAQPWLWRFERMREQLDAMPQDFNEMLPAEFRMPELHPHIRERNHVRDQMRTTMRLLVRFSARYLFGADDELRQQFRARVATMQLVDACLWSEEQVQANDSQVARETFNQFRSFTNPDDYEVTPQGARWHPPAGVLPNAEEQRLQSICHAMIGLDLLGANALRDYLAPENVSAYEQVGQATEAELIAGRFTGQDLEYARRSVLRCAGVSVTFGALAQAPPTTWATIIIRDAARAQAAQNWSFEEEDIDALDMRISIATALAALLAADPEDNELRELVFHAASIAPTNVGASILRGLTPTWATRPQLPVNVLLILLAAALSDGSVTLSAASIAAHLAMEKVGGIGTVPSFRSTSKKAMYRIAHVLPAALVSFEQPSTVDLLVPLADRLLALLQSEDTDDDAFSLSLTSSVARFAANLFVALPASGHDNFRAAIIDWDAAPEFYGEVVLAVVHGHIGFREINDRAIERFLAMAQSFLTAEHHAELKREYVSSVFKKACWALIFVEEFVGVILLAPWPHAGRFAHHIGHWVAKVGGHPTTASALVAFLDRFHPAFTATQLVGWISDAAATTSAHLRAEFWRRNGDSIGTLFLRLLTERSDDFREPSLRATAAGVADQLVSAGISLGGEIRRALEASAAW